MKGSASGHRRALIARIPAIAQATEARMTTNESVCAGLIGCIRNQCNRSSRR